MARKTGGRKPGGPKVRGDSARAAPVSAAPAGEGAARRRGGAGVPSVLFELLLLALSSLLFALSFPNFLSRWGFFPLAFVALVPLFIVIRRAGWLRVALYGAFYGFVSYALFNFWLGKFHPLALLIVPPIHAGYFLLLFPLLKAAVAFFPGWGFLLQSLLWVGFELLKTQGFLAYSYGNLGYSQYLFLPLVQIAELTGVWGLSLLVIFPSAFAGNLLAGAADGAGDSADRFAAGAADGAWAMRPGSAKAAGAEDGAPAGAEEDEQPAAPRAAPRKRARLWAPPAVYAAVFLLAVGWGLAGRVDLKEARPWRVALVQQNVDPWRGGYRAYRKSLDISLRLSREALAADPRVQAVIWSETSFVPAIDWHTRYRQDPEAWRLVQELLDFMALQRVPFVVGNDDGQLVRSETGEEQRVDYNATILFDRGRIAATYRKLHLVPFTEYFPFEKTLPGVYQWLRNADTHFWEKGTEYTVFDASGVKFSTPICFEDTFGYLNREFVRRGAEVLVNMTNDSWSNSVAAEMQHLGMSLLRAVENRRSMVRATNGGITGIISPNGEILSMIPPFSEGTLIGDVPVYTQRTTLYTRWGDWLGWLALFAAAAGLLAGAARKAARKPIKRIDKSGQLGENGTSQKVRR